MPSERSDAEKDALKAKIVGLRDRAAKVKLRSQKQPLEGTLVDMTTHGYPEGTHAIQVAGGNWRPFTEEDVETVEEV